MVCQSGFKGEEAVFKYLQLANVTMEDGDEHYMKDLCIDCVSAKREMDGEKVNSTPHRAHLTCATHAICFSCARSSSFGAQLWTGSLCCGSCEPEK